MDINSLRYFVKVAKALNINAVAREIHITPSALSKAILRLEEELEVSLFSRSKQRLSLTPVGVILLGRANQILQLEEETLSCIRETTNHLNITICGPEVGLLLGSDFVLDRFESRKDKVSLNLIPVPENKVFEKLDTGEAQLGVVCGPCPKKFISRTLQKIKFVTCASNAHPIVLKHNKSISIDELLTYPFVRGDFSFYGEIMVSGNPIDGWRDDKFPRKVNFNSSSLKLMEHLLVQGHALAYLPDYYAKMLPVKVLNVTGCPYTCEQTLKIVAKSNAPSWIRELMSNPKILK